MVIQVGVGFCTHNLDYPLEQHSRGWNYLRKDLVLGLWKELEV